MLRYADLGKRPSVPVVTAEVSGKGAALTSPGVTALTCANVIVKTCLDTYWT